MYSAVLITAPSTEPISVSELKVHLRLDTAYTADDAYLVTLLAAARQKIEDFTGRGLITQTWRLTMDRYPAEPHFELPMAAPLQSITSFTYRDTSGSQITVDTSVYTADTNAMPGRLCLKTGQSYPSASTFISSPIQVTYIVGHSSVSAIPPVFKQALMLLSGHLYENRQGEAPVAKYNAQVSADLPASVKSLLYTHRIQTPCPIVRGLEAV